MIQYITGVANEFKQIRWLSAKKAFVLTIITIVATFAMGFALGAADSVFTAVVRSIVIEIPDNTEVLDSTGTTDSIEIIEDTTAPDEV